MLIAMRPAGTKLASGDLLRSGMRWGAQACSGEQGMSGTGKRGLAAIAAASFLLAACLPAGAASRIKDLANIEGVRQNQLIGYGLVVGLNKTGDFLNNIPFTKQSLQ